MFEKYHHLSGYFIAVIIVFLLFMSFFIVKKFKRLGEQLKQAQYDLKEFEERK